MGLFLGVKATRVRSSTGRCPGVQTGSAGALFQSSDSGLKLQHLLCEELPVPSVDWEH